VVGPDVSAGGWWETGECFLTSRWCLSIPSLVLPPAMPRAAPHSLHKLCHFQTFANSGRRSLTCVFLIMNKLECPFTVQRIYAHTCTHVCTQHTHLYVHGHIFMHMYTCTAHVYVHLCTHTAIFSCTNTYTQTCIHTYFCETVGYIDCLFFFFFFLGMRLGFVLRASHLQSRCVTT
jgi:hypothetical protein